MEVDGVRDELGVLLHDLLDLGLLEVLLEAILDVENDPGTTAETGGLLIVDNGERAACAGLPQVLLYTEISMCSNPTLGAARALTIIVRLCVDLDLVGNQVCRVETNTELTNHGDIGTSGQRLHELLGTRAGNGTKVVDEIRLCETDTSITAASGVSYLNTIQTSGRILTWSMSSPQHWG